MSRKDLTKYKQKYHAFRHHAWAGTVILSVILAIRLLFLESTELLTPVIVIVAIYIIIALVFTYLYRAGLYAEDKVVQVESSIELEKERLKVEKKKAKAEAKARKKGKK